MLKLPDGTVKVLVEGGERALIDRFNVGDHFSAEITLLNEEDRHDEREIDVLVRSIITQFEQYVKLNKKVPPEVLTSLSGIDEPGRLADTVAAHMNLKLSRAIDGFAIVHSTLDMPEKWGYVFDTLEAEAVTATWRVFVRDLVRWSLFTMINAEELKVNSANVDRVREQAAKPEVRGLLDLDGSSGKALGIAPQWGYRIIKQVGNYGESFERNLGKQSPLKIKRGLNALWNYGGLMYAPPSR